MSITAYTRRILESGLANRRAATELANVINTAANQTTGNTFYVDSGAGSDNTGSGSLDQPYATLDYAIGRCTASNGDVIYLKPGHAETKSVTGSLFAADVAGISIIGLGFGASRPTLTLSHTGAATTISAGGISLSNILFVAGIDSITAPITISGPDCAIVNCEFRDTTDVEAVRWIVTTAAAERLKLYGLFYNGYTGGNAAINFARLVGVDGAQIYDCVFLGKNSTAVIEFETTACTKVDIDNCLFLVDSTTNLSKNIVDTATGSTWAARNCFDLAAGSAFGGGSGAALAGDDVASVAASVATLQAEVSGAAGIVSFPAAAAPGNAVSLAEVIRDIWDSVRNGTGGTEPGTNKSIIDAVGFDGVARVTASAGQLAAANGRRFSVTSIVKSDNIPNNTQTGGAITGASSGGRIIVHDIIVQTDGTGWVAPTNIEFTVDNVKGLTGAGAPLGLEVIGSFGANKTVVMSVDGTTKIFPFVLESGKKVFIHGDDAAGTGAGTADVTLICESADDGATIAGADLNV